MDLKETRAKINRDIEAVTEVLNARNNERALNLFDVLRGTYEGILKDLKIGLLPTISSSNIYDHHTTYIYDNVYKNLEIIRNKLELFALQQFQPGAKTSMFDFSDSYALAQYLADGLEIRDVIARLEAMAGISDSELKIVVQMAVEIGQILSDETTKKRDKWAKIRPFIAKLSEGNADIFIAIVPLLLKLGE